VPPYRLDAPTTARCLHEEQILPRIISGSSAGAVVAAMVGVRTTEELSQLLADDLSNLSSHFWLQAPPL